MKKSNDKFYKKNPVDLFVNIFRRFKFLEPIIRIYDKYKESLLYLFFGALTTFVNIIVYAIFTKCFNIDYIVSNLIAWIIAVIFAYITNKLYVFESKTNNIKELIKEISSFFLARIISLLLDVAIMYIGVSILKFNDMIIKILANIFVIVANYFMSKIFIFKKK